MLEPLKMAQLAGTSFFRTCGGAGPQEAADLIRRRSADSIWARGANRSSDFRGRIYARVSIPSAKLQKLLRPGWVHICPPKTSPAEMWLFGFTDAFTMHLSKNGLAEKHRMMKAIRSEYRFPESSQMEFQRPRRRLQGGPGCVQAVDLLRELDQPKARKDRIEPIRPLWPYKQDEKRSSI